MTTPETQEQKVERLADETFWNTHTAGCLTIQVEYWKRGFKAGYTRALEDKEVKLASCCAENEEKLKIAEKALWDIGMRSVYPLSINEDNFLDIKRVATEAIMKLKEMDNK